MCAPPRVFTSLTPEGLTETRSRLRGVPADQQSDRSQARLAAVIGNRAMNQNAVNPQNQAVTVSEFSGTKVTVGTEQELSAVNIRLPISIGGKQVGYIEGTDPKYGRVRLWNITKDLAHPSGIIPEGYMDYTVEMVSCPAPIEDAAAWNMRRAAFDEFIKEIRSLSYNSEDQRVLSTKQLGMFQMIMLEKAKVIVPDGFTESVNTSFQYTKGTTLSHIPALMEEEQAPWFQASLISYAGDLGDEASQIVFAYVMSVAIRDSQIYVSLYNKYGGSRDIDTVILSSLAKNLWDVLPRTPLRKAVCLLDKAHQEAVLAKAETYPVSPVEPQEIFMCRYKKLIASMKGTETIIRAGELDTRDTIDGKPVFLFEKRNPGASETPPVFQWRDSPNTEIPEPDYGSWNDLVYLGKKIGGYRPEGFKLGLQMEMVLDMPFQVSLGLGSINYHPEKPQTYFMRYVLKAGGREENRQGIVKADPAGNLELVFRGISEAAVPENAHIIKVTAYI